MSYIRPAVCYRMGGWLWLHHEGGENSEIRKHMLDYLVALFDDADYFSWDVAKTGTPFCYAECNREK